MKGKQLELKFPKLTTKRTKLTQAYDDGESQGFFNHLNYYGLWEDGEKQAHVEDQRKGYERELLRKVQKYHRISPEHSLRVIKGYLDSVNKEVKQHEALLKDKNKQYPEYIRELFKQTLQTAIDYRKTLPIKKQKLETNK